MSTSVRPISVFLAEDHAITLWGLQRLIEDHAERMRVVGTAASRQALLANAALAQTDVLVIDLDLGDADGVAIIPEVLRLTQARVLVLTASEDTPRLCRAVEAGAKGVLHKSEAPQQIVTAIEQLHAGGGWLNPQLMGAVLGMLAPTQARQAAQPNAVQQRINSLTPRELGIVQALAQSPGDKLLAVASRLGMSENTLRNHLTTIYGKLGVRGRLELHVFAGENGLTTG